MNTYNDGISIKNVVKVVVDLIDNAGERSIFTENAFMPDWK